MGLAAGKYAGGGISRSVSLESSADLCWPNTLLKRVLCWSSFSGSSIVKIVVTESRLGFGLSGGVWRKVTGDWANW